METFVKILTLENGIKAELLDKVLSERGIPHMIKSHYDTALNGMFQLQMGWGYVAAPPEYEAEIREIYDDLSA